MGGTVASLDYRALVYWIASVKIGDSLRILVAFVLPGIHELLALCHGCLLAQLLLALVVSRPGIAVAAELRRSCPAVIHP